MMADKTTESQRARRSLTDPGEEPAVIMLRLGKDERPVEE